jgi:hypothetical protein
MYRLSMSIFTTVKFTEDDNFAEHRGGKGTDLFTDEQISQPAGLMGGLGGHSIVFLSSGKNDL